MRNPGWAVAAVLAIAVGPARAACTPEQLQEFAEKGISNATIDQVCGSLSGAVGGFLGNQVQPQSPVQQMPGSQICLTNLGSCVMVVPGFVGQPCTCPSVWGSVVGTIR